MMYLGYNILIIIAGFVLKIVAIFNKKLHLFVAGRKETFEKLSRNILNSDKVIWMHCASLGEFEQGRPILEKLKKQYSNHKLILTFFSPSGYEVRKNYKGADVVCYLPLDTRANAKKFIELVQPELAIFVKYEFWPNILKELKKNAVKTILISGIFRKKQWFFSNYGGWMRKSLHTFSHFFVQDKNSQKLLHSIDIERVTVIGDTRFDRVNEITKQNNQLDFITSFKNNKTTLVAGSTWKEDEDMLVEYINKGTFGNEKFIIAPHNINQKAVTDLKERITKKVILFSEMQENHTHLANFDVFIVDTIGILTKIYSYADMAYVGGGFTKSGVHNVLEPATFGIPVIIGPNYHKFNEAVELVRINACFVTEDCQNLSVILKKFFQKEEIRKEVGVRALNYVVSRIGATDKILNYLKDERKTG